MSDKPEVVQREGSGLDGQSAMQSVMETASNKHGQVDMFRMLEQIDAIINTEDYLNNKGSVTAQQLEAIPEPTDAELHQVEAEMKLEGTVEAVVEGRKDEVTKTAFNSVMDALQEWKDQMKTIGSDAWIDQTYKEHGLERGANDFNCDVDDDWLEDSQDDGMRFDADIDEEAYMEKAMERGESMGNDNYDELRF